MDILNGDIHTVIRVSLMLDASGGVMYLASDSTWEERIIGNEMIFLAPLPVEALIGCPVATADLEMKPEQLPHKVAHTYRYQPLMK